MNQKRLLLVAVFSLFYFLSHTQNIRFDHFDINDGLSQNSAFCMDVDANGYVWVGTLNGLNRYNGYEFDFFKPTIGKKGSIKGSLFRSLTCDNQGNVWTIAQDAGLSKYDYTKQEFINYSDSIFNEYIPKSLNFIKVDIRGWVWMANSDDVIGFNPADSTIVKPIIEGNINGISVLPNGHAGIYGNSGLHEMYLSIDSTYIPVLKIQDPIITLGHDGNKTVAIHHNKIAIYEQALFKPTQEYLFDHIKDSPKSFIESTILVESSNIWLRGKNSLIKYTINEEAISCNNYSYDPGNSNSFRGYFIYNIIKDKSGNVWIGTSKHGINIISKRKNSFKHLSWDHDNYDDIEIDPVRAICATSTGECWLGFDRIGVGIIHNDGTQTLKTTYVDKTGKHKTIRNVRTIFEDKDANLWVGMYDGISIYNKVTGQLEHIDRHIDGHLKKRSYSIVQYDSARVLVAIGRQLSLVNLKNKTQESLNYTQTNDQILSNIRDMHISDSIIWIGLDNTGIAKVNTHLKTLKSYNSQKIGLSNSKIYSLAVIGNDLWIATNNGLNRFNTLTSKVEKVYYEEDGLSNNIVYSLNADQDKNLWMSSNRGISKLIISNEQFTSYLNSDFFMDDASYQDKDGNIYYGGYTGVAFFNPQDIETNEHTLIPHIEQFSLNNSVVRPNEKINNHIIINEHIDKVSHLNLNYYENSFSFDFNALQFEIPNTNKFRYKLDNWQDTWTEQEGNNRKAAFTNVAPGNYTFQLSVASSNEEWSAAKTISINIEPPFWQKLWFQLMILALIFIILFLLYRWRLYRIQQRNEQLKQQVDEQTKDILKKSDEIKSISEKLHEADEAKLRFFTNISHEFRTPLTLILGYLEELEDTKSFTVKKVIKSNALRLLRLVNQLIEFRKLDQDQLKLEVSNFELNQFVGEIVTSFQKLANQKNITLSFEPADTRISVWLDIDKTEKILFNLITNAIKYTAKNKPIIVSTSERTNHCSILVKDYGMGISQEELPHVFDRFFRSKNSQQSGHGIGLALAKGLVETQFGTLTVDSEKGKGSEFMVVFNKGKEHFNEHEIVTSSPLKPFASNNSEDIHLPAAPTTIANKLILLVEDDAELNRFLNRILSDKYTVSTAENGVEALQKLDSIIPDLIISDITMPQMDGITFCKKVKDNASTSKIPFILLTAKTDSLVRIEGFKLGIDDYIEKPFDKQILTARVDALLSNRDKLEQEPVQTKTIAHIDKSKFSKSEVQFWKKANTIIQRNYGNPNFTTEALSEKMNMSRSTFYRKFKGLSGENTADYIRKIRLHKAAELLQRKQLTIQQISLEVGFQSTAHFRTKFKEHFGINPSEYV